jgi:exosortase A-associated hydrolase 2
MVAPFAEEMNKSRKMLTDVSHALAEHAVATVLPDLYGTGDSEGEFRDALWDGWAHDLQSVASWASHEGSPVTALLCVRTGCLLGAQLARVLGGSVTRTVFWQPVIEGERFLTQFLRLRVAASMSGPEKESTAGLRERLRSGEHLEVSGYELSEELVAGIETARLTTELTPDVGRLHWMEVVRGDDGELPGASTRAIEAARAAGVTVETHAIPGEPFWSSTEIVRISALVEQTVSALVGS